MLGLNKSSKRIPIFVETIDEAFSRIKEGETVNSRSWFEKVLADFFGKLLYGKDILESDVRLDYELSNGSFARLTILEAMTRMLPEFVAAAR